MAIPSQDTHSFWQAPGPFGQARRSDNARSVATVHAEESASLAGRQAKWSFPSRWQLHSPPGRKGMRWHWA